VLFVQRFVEQMGNKMPGNPLFDSTDLDLDCYSMSLRAVLSRCSKRGKDFKLWEIWSRKKIL